MCLVSRRAARRNLMMRLLDSQYDGECRTVLSATGRLDRDEEETLYRDNKDKSKNTPERKLAREMSEEELSRVGGAKGTVIIINPCVGDD